MKIFKNKLLTACLSLLLMIPNIGAEDTIAKSGELLDNGQQNKIDLADKNKESRKAKDASDAELVPVSLDGLAIGIIATGLAAAYLCDEIVDLVTYILKKSENGVDMRGVTERGYRNKHFVKKTPQELCSKDVNYCYLYHKWHRIDRSIRSYDDSKSDHAVYSVPIYFADHLPTVRDPSSITDDDLINSWASYDDLTKRFDLHGCGLYEPTSTSDLSDLGLLGWPASTQISDGYKQQARKKFEKTGYLNFFGMAHPWSEEHVGPVLYHTPEFACLETLYLSKAPDDKYFKIYYYTAREPWSRGAFRGKYERFNYNSWARDVFHKSFDEVLKMHKEVFLKHNGLFLETGLDMRQLDVRGAEEDIETWRQTCVKPQI